MKPKKHKEIDPDTAKKLKEVTEVKKGKVVSK